MMASTIVKHLLTASITLILKATNGQIIGTSEMYEAASGRDNGIESVKTNAPAATVKEE